MTREDTLIKAMVQANEIAVPPGGEMVAIREIQAIIERALIDAGVQTLGASTLQPAQDHH